LFIDLGVYLFIYLVSDVFIYLCVFYLFVYLLSTQSAGHRRVGEKGGRAPRKQKQTNRRDTNEEERTATHTATHTHMTKQMHEYTQINT